MATVMEAPLLRERKAVPSSAPAKLSEKVTTWFKDHEELLQPSNFKASKTLVKGLVLSFLGVMCLAYLPWYCLPLGWFLLGAAQLGLTTIAQDCNDNLFVSSKLLNQIVGAACLLPLGIDVEGYRATLEKTSGDASSKRQRAVRWLMKTHLWCLASPVEWVTTLYESHLANWRRAKLATVANLLTVYAIASFFALTMWYKVGVWGLLKYYFFPLVAYHIWKSTIMKMDKSLPELALPSIPHFTESISPRPSNGPEEPETEETPTYIKYPKWVEFLTNNCNLALSEARKKAQMPTYNMKQALQACNAVELPFHWKDIFLPNKAQAAPAAKAEVEGEAKAEPASLLSEVDWVTGSFITITPLIALYGLFTCDFHWGTWVVAFFSYALSGTGITMGYHRLFSHRSWDTIMPIKVIVTLMGTGAFQGSVLTWCYDHRIHHRYTDTDDDPYSAHKGLWWAHMGWLFWLRKHKVRADISDLEAIPFLRFQHNYYPLLAMFIGLVAPAAICGFCWGDWRGGILIAGVLSKVVIMHCTFCINSIAHYWGDATFTDQRTPRDSAIVSFVTFGEGYHNFHHEFPYDFRNGVHATAWDPTKWVVATLEYLGLAYSVARVEEGLYTKGKLHMQQKALDELKSKLPWGKPVEELPFVSWKELRARRHDEEGASFVVVDGIVYDVVKFLDEHPGGRGILSAFLGKDITKAFNGGVYNHSLAARHVLDCLRVARVLPEEAE